MGQAVWPAEPVASSGIPAPHHSSPRPHAAVPPSKQHQLVKHPVGWLGFNGTFSTNRLYHAINKDSSLLKCLFLIGS